MNQVFHTFTFKSDAPTFLLIETLKGVQFCIDEGQNIAPDQIDSVIEALQAIKASIAKKGNQENNGESNGESKGDDKGEANDKDNGEEAIGSGTILPPFNFNTPEKLKALLGRIVELRGGSVAKVQRVDLKCDIAEEETIELDDSSWRYSNGLYFIDETDSRDIIKVLPKSS